MTRFVIAQLAARWPQALMLVLLSAAATAAAVSAPVYAGAADRAVIAAELAAADRSELFVASAPQRREWSATPLAGPAASPLPDPAASLLGSLDGFVPVVSVQVPVSGLDTADDPEWLVARQDLCSHVVVRAGRCPVANREVALSPAHAAATGVRPGDEVVLTPVAEPAGGAEPTGPAAGFTVTGVVEAGDPDDPYWGLHHDSVGDAIYTTPNSITRLEHRDQWHTASAVLDPGHLTAGSVPVIRAELDRVLREATRLSGNGGGPALHSNLPQLLDRITDSSAQTRQLLPVAAVPLVVLCWFVVYLAAAHAIGGRRPELGAVAVRGAPTRVRAALAGGELVLPVLAGAPLGIAAGHAVVAAATGGWVPAAANQWAAAGLAVAGSLVAVLLGLRRVLTAPAVALLRWVPPRRRRWVLATAEVLVVALAAVAVLQLRLLDGDLVGITVLAPALVILAVALLVARAVWPAARLIGRRALRRGHVDRAVAAIHLCRRPATARLLVVVTVVLGMLGFAVVAADVAGQQRAGHAERVTGAARVLEVRQVDRVHLLRVVRRADPEGRYAMAAVAASGGPGAPPRLAVDTTRLANVAGWRAEYGGLDPQRAADLLRPPVPASLPVSDGAVAVDLSVPDGAPPGSTVLSMTLVSASGERLVVRFGPLAHGRSVHHAEVSGCPDGCRLAYLSVSVTGDGPAAVTWHGVEQDGQDLVPAGWRTGAWRQVADGDAGRVAVDNGIGGLTVAVDEARRGVFYRVLPPDAPHPLPVAIAGAPAGTHVTNVDNQPVAVTPVARLAGLPRFGDRGVLMDLEYAERSATAPGTTGSLEVWLAADAPREVVDRLIAGGLVVTDERTVAGLRELLDGSGPAVALRYHLLAAGMAALVALAALAQVALADRRTWTVSLRRLRVQGLPRRTVTATVLWSYGGLVAIGTSAGVVAAAAGWLATGDRLPLGVEPLATVGPQWTPVLVPWLAAVAALFAGGAVAAWWQRGAAGREVVR